MMTVFKINKIQPGKAALYRETEINRIYSDVIGSTYDGSTYTFATKLATVLNRLNVGTWEAVNIGPNNVSKAIVDSVGVDIPGESLMEGLILGPALTPLIYLRNQVRERIPIILLVNWTQGGAHFVVVDMINDTPFGMFASVCDPWDGNVHITKFSVGSTFDYLGAKVPFSWDLGGTRHDYTTDSPGSPKGWIIRQTSS
jgi:hypothetical protein